MENSNLDAVFILNMVLLSGHNQKGARIIASLYLYLILLHSLTLSVCVSLWTIGWHTKEFTI